MSSNSVREKPQDFARWLRPILLGEADGKVAKRWTVLDPFIRGAKVGDILPLVSNSFGFPIPSGFSADPFVELFRATEETFNKQDNAEEIRTLSGAAIASLLVMQDPLQVFTALCVATTSCAGVRKPTVDIPLAELAASSLARVSVEQRERKAASAPPSLPKFDKESFDALGAKLSQNPAGHAVEVVTNMGNLVSTHASKTATALSNYLQSLRREAQLRDEELSYLAWIVNGWSAEAQKPWTDVDRKAAIALYPCELAALSEHPPGPPSVAATLSRADVSSVRTVTIPGVVNALELDWMEARLSKNAVSDLCLPFHAAAYRRLETKDKESWQAGWKAVTHIEPTREFAERDLARQIYLERMLARSFVPRT